MPVLGVSDENWTELIAASGATCWLFPDHPALQGLRDALSKIEMESPELVIQIMEITETKYQELDNDKRDRVDSWRKNFR